MNDQKEKEKKVGSEASTLIKKIGSHAIGMVIGVGIFAGLQWIKPEKTIL